MWTLNVVYKTGEVNRIACSEHDAKRAAFELNRRSDVVRAWVEGN